MKPSHVIPVIVISQFAGTSLWFAGNTVLPAQVLSFVQFGFISGTLLFAVFSIPDRYSPSWVFFISSLLAALSNLLLAWFPSDPALIKTGRFLTGFFLAGIYPVGMKIAADWYEKGLGKVLGWLVGALVLGSASPFLLRSITLAQPASAIAWITSCLAVAGGLLVVLFIKDGPYRKKNTRFDPRAALAVFKPADFRSAAFGYFGHMWELYSFWAFVPFILKLNGGFTNEKIIAYSAFIVIAAGSVGCIASGYVAEKIGSARTAFIALLSSFICCLLAAIVIDLPGTVFTVFMVFWGFMVVADSPQFSSLVALTAPPEWKGTAITIVTCIGFAITIGSIEFMNAILEKPARLLYLAPGPAIGLFFLWRLAKRKPAKSAG
jgi:MFS family permease